MIGGLIIIIIIIIQILSKGKVIYPPPQQQQQPSSSSSTSSASKEEVDASKEEVDTAKKERDEQELSNKILDMSKLSSRSGKVALLVMGTRTGEELKEIPYENQQQQQSSSPWLLTFAWQVGQNVIKTSWSLFQSIIRIVYSNVIQPVLLLATTATNNRRHSNTADVASDTTPQT